MQQSDSQTPLRSTLRKTKAVLLALALTLGGVLLIMSGGWLDGLQLGAWDWLHALPIGEFGGILLGAGLLSTLFEYTFRRDQEASTIEQFRAIIKEQAPAMRDAVVDGFAIHPEDLKRVANPELLDDIATNVMALRLGDEQFARELYASIRDQAIRSPERWYDVEVRARLSTAVERSTAGTPLFDLTVEWEYTTVPSHTVRRFACVSDRDEYNELVTDVPATMTWFMAPRPGADPSARDNFELLAFSVDGEALSIRRAQRKAGQTYTAHLPDAAAADTPVRIRFLLRTRTPSWGHRLFFELPQPARGMSLTMDYTDTTIAEMRVSDLAATAHPAQITRMPDSVKERTISVEVPGWLLPKAGFAFSWSMDSELPRGQRGREAA